MSIIPLIGIHKTYIIIARSHIGVLPAINLQLNLQSLLVIRQCPVVIASISIHTPYIAIIHSHIGVLLTINL